MRHTALVTLAVLVTAAPLAAQVDQPLHGNGSPADVKAGTYAIEPNHTQVTFAVSHFGISPFSGSFSGASGTMTLDPTKPAATSLSVSLPVDSVMTTSSRLTDELKSADWLDAAKFPTATFRSTSVTPMGHEAANVQGMLTLHGVTKPATMTVRFFGAATNPMSKKASVGFLGRMAIKRSDFGVSKYVPVVSDETVLVINGAFEKQ